MAGEAIEVAIEGLYVHGTVRHGLCPVNEDGNVVGVRDADNLFNRIYGSQRIGDVCHGHNFGSVRDKTV